MCKIFESFKDFVTNENKTVELSEKALKLLNTMKETKILPIKDVKYDNQPAHVKELIDAGFLEIDRKHRDIKIKEITLGSTLGVSESKSIPKNTGDIHEYKGKKYKKQPNGKWLEVSERGMSKKEDKEQAYRYANKSFKERGQSGNSLNNEKTRLHVENANKLSDKEYTDKELGINESTNDMNKSVECADLGLSTKNLDKPFNRRSEYHPQK